MRSFILLLFLAFHHSATATGSDGRLDPHGSRDTDVKNVNMKEQKACTTCHFVSGSLKPDFSNSCFNCHNQAPHSGVAEHMNKSQGTSKVTCLSCHSAHRFSSLSADTSHFFKKTETPALPPGLVLKNKTEAMLQKTCTDCHKW